MDYLALVKDLALESGSVAPASVTSVAGATGRIAKLVSWVDKAWENIQNSREDWMWMADEFSKDLIPGAAAYTGAGSWSLTRWGRWLDELPVTLYDAAKGQSDEGELTYVPYAIWRAKWVMGVHDQNRPTEYTVKHNGELAFGPTPDEAYKVRGMYQKAPQTLTLNTDVPEMPSRHHRIITMEAHRLLMIHDGAFQESQWPTAEYAMMRSNLERDQLPSVTFGDVAIGL